ADARGRHQGRADPQWTVMGGMLDRMSRFVAGDADRRDRALAIDRLRQGERLGRGVVMVRERAGMRHDADVRNAPGAQHLGRRLSPGQAAQAHHLRVLLERRPRPPARPKREQKRGADEVEIVVVVEHGLPPSPEFNNWRQAGISGSGARHPGRWPGLTGHGPSGRKSYPPGCFCGPKGRVTSAQATGLGSTAAPGCPTDRVRLPRLHPTAPPHPLASSISLTAADIPISTARETRAWPMFSSSIPSMAAIGPTFSTVRPWPA